jgi:hypothetical protein
MHFDQTDLTGTHTRFALGVRPSQAAKECHMTDPRNGKGGFKEFAQHENGTAAKAMPLGASQPVKPAPIVGTPAPKPDIVPAAKADKTLTNPPGGTKPTLLH